MADLRTWVTGLFDRGPLLRHDRARWAAARSLTDLAELTAQWLEGRIASQPNYYGPVDVDEHHAPGLTAALVGLNRAGVLTVNSQAGFDRPGHDGLPCQQLAWVSGIAEEGLYERLETAVRGSGYQIVPATRRGRLPVTWVAGDAYTVSGLLRTPAELRREFAGCGHAAVDEACAGVQFDLIDPDPGRNTLWLWLTQVAASLTEPMPSTWAPSPRPVGPQWRDHGGGPISTAAGVSVQPLLPSQRGWGKS